MIEENNLWEQFDQFHLNYDKICLNLNFFTCFKTFTMQCKKEAYNQIGVYVMLNVEHNYEEERKWLIVFWKKNLQIVECICNHLFWVHIL